MPEPRILIVDDEKIVRESLTHWFEEEGYIIESAENGNEALKIFEEDKFDLALVDMKMPGMTGLELLKKIKEIDEDCFVILITAFASVPTAIQALKDGAYDYVTKPVDPDELEHLVKNALESRALKSENKQLKKRIDNFIIPENLIGESPQMNKIFEMIKTVSETDSTVMIRGESGTGKELIAKAIHSNSKRKYFPIITVNCGALPESLLESELFGHEKGAFTGAHFRRKGKFELANGGTIFLDEIGTVSPKTQVELLRVIETKKFYRVGGSDVVESDFRIITATNESLEQLIEEGKFRKDLYYRLNVLTITIPPLRDRTTDIPILVSHFVKKYSELMNKDIKGITDKAYEFLMKYEWPGNVRELENTIERAIVIGKGDHIDIDDLNMSNENNNFKMNESSAEENGNSLNDMEKRYILKVLNDNNWNISKSAEILEIERVTLYNKINKYDLRKNK
ncbi:MAG: sigma-54 dependent transcriptional regulator [Ignavibacteria bacterium]|jgi:DNA-binding NtrC family response regulator|nr:sigma-54 dependent transcriptional regulator [Ignavibacteria bacterium]